MKKPLRRREYVELAKAYGVTHSRKTVARLAKDVRDAIAFDKLTKEAKRRGISRGGSKEAIALRLLRPDDPASFSPEKRDRVSRIARAQGADIPTEGIDSIVKALREFREEVRAGALRSVGADPGAGPAPRIEATKLHSEFTKSGDSPSAAMSGATAEAAITAGLSSGGFVSAAITIDGVTHDIPFDVLRAGPKAVEEWAIRAGLWDGRRREVAFTVYAMSGLAKSPDRKA